MTGARQNRAWIFSHFWRTPKAKVADYPRSFTRQEIFHARMSDNPRSMRTISPISASVSICNSKRIIPPLSVTDRDKPEAWLAPNPLAYRQKRNGPCPTKGNRARNSHGASDRKSAYSLRESAPASDAWRHPRPLATNASRPLDARASAGSIPAHTRNGPCPTKGNRARNSHGASDRNRTCNPLITSFSILVNSVHLRL